MGEETDPASRSRKSEQVPAVKSSEIINQLIDAIHESGGSAACLSEDAVSNPKKFVVSYQGNIYDLWVYAWTLTHGGRKSLPREYRIQMTSVPSPLKINPGGLTALMGYCPESGVFAGFDLAKHRVFTEGSPSVQVDIDAVRGAMQSGLTFATKENDEIVIGVRRDQFLTYCINAKAFHGYGSEKNLAAMLSRVVKLQDIPQKELSALTEDRRRIVENVSRYSRDANFRKLVMDAYDNRCAVTGTQLRLVDAAHILPVSSDGSRDHVTNGLALSPTFHRAFDTSLVYLSEDYVMKLNEERVGDLRAVNLLGGLDAFRSFLDQTIRLPEDISQRPKVEYVIKANRYRRIPGYV